MTDADKNIAERLRRIVAELNKAIEEADVAGMDVEIGRLDMDRLDSVRPMPHLTIKVWVQV